MIDLTPASKALGLNIDGILGSDILRKYRITLNFSTGSVKVDLNSRPPTNGFVVKLHAIDSRYFVPVTIQGAPMELSGVSSFFPSIQHPRVDLQANPSAALDTAKATKAKNPLKSRVQEELAGFQR